MVAYRPGTVIRTRGSRGFVNANGQTTHALIDIKTLGRDVDPWGKFRSEDDDQGIAKIVEVVKKDRKLWVIFLDPQDNYVIEGRRRLAACHQLGVEKVPVMYVEKIERE